MHVARELFVLLAGLSSATLITVTLVRRIVPAWWRRQDRLAAQRSSYRTRRPP